MRAETETKNQEAVMTSRFVSEFPLEEPPTMPHRTVSGGILKGTVIRAMAQQQEAFNACNRKLDELIVLADEVQRERTLEQTQ